MLDMLGIEVEVGDEVIFTNGGQSDTGLYRGRVLKITSWVNTIGRETMEAKLIKIGGKIQQKTRTQGEILSIKSFKITHPELFI